MTEPRRRAWVYDPWADDDPAIARMRDVLRGPEPVQEAPQRPQPVEVESDSTPELVAAPEAPRRVRVGALVWRVRAGDHSAVEALRRALGG